jgi:hypothetical protein
MPVQKTGFFDKNVIRKFLITPISCGLTPENGTCCGPEGLYNKGNPVKKRNGTVLGNFVNSLSAVFYSSRV